MEPMQGRFEMDKFDGKGDFSLWRFKLLGQLEIQGLASVLMEQEKSEGGTDRKIDPKDKLRDCRVKNLIIASLHDDLIRKVMYEPTALDMLNILERDYQLKSLPNRILIKRKFTNFKMSNDKSMDDNLNDYQRLLSEMVNLNIPLSEEDKAFQLLSSLPEQYEPIAYILRYGVGRDTLTMSEVTTAVYTRQAELLEKGLLNKPKTTSEGLFVANKGKSEKKYQQPWKNKDKKFVKPKYKSKSKTNKNCFICGKEGHWKANCPQNRDKVKNSKSANVATDYTESMVLTASIQDTKEEWILDSGCTFHITPNKENLYDFEEIEGGKVFMGNNTHSEIKGIGKIKIKNPNNTTVVLTGVRYMPTMSRNLISYGQLEKSGCKYEGGDFTVTFFKDGQHVISGKYQGGLYHLQGKIISGEVAFSKGKQDMTKVWHSRLGHMSSKCMGMLVKKGLLQSKEINPFEFCEECVLGKSQKQRFKKGKHTSKAPLEYVHSDIWGSPGVEESLSGCKYFITFIDDYSRKVWIYFLKTKDEAFEKFAEWKNLVETQSRRKIKCLRTDNGLEFCNNLFDSLCATSGIKRHKTCAYTPQQNGVAERMNKTIMNKVRCMLVESGFEKKLWAETASTTVYLINMSPTSALDFKIPEEVWSEKDITLTHIKRFGCSAYIHVIQDKISPRAIKGFFVGYPSGVKGYRIWIPKENKCLVSRNVVFYEEELYKNEAEAKEHVSEAAKIRKGKAVQLRTMRKTVAEEGSTSRGYEQLNSESDSEQEETESENVLVNQNSVPDDYLLARDRARRVSKVPARYDDENFVAYALNCAENIELDEPKSVMEAKGSREWKQWHEAMKEEMESLKKNETWEVVPKPEKQKTVGCKWIFKWKEGIPQVEAPRFKARLVAKGFTQVEGVDYNEIFAPVVKHVSIRIILSLVATFDLELEQLDVKTAFLHGTLEEVIYMDQPEEFVDSKKRNHVCLLKKSLYGLKQSPRQWNQKFDQFMKSQSFKRSEFDPCVYLKGSQINDLIYLLIYVDDMLIASKDISEIKKLKRNLRQKFEMKDLGPARRILGMDIIRERQKGILRLSQGKYLEQVLRTFNMGDAKPVATPVNSQIKLRSLNEEEQNLEATQMESIPYSSAVGSLMYAMIGTRPDIAHAIGLVSRFMTNPGRIHWSSVKWILRYIKGKAKMGLVFSRQGDSIEIEGFCDSDYAADVDKRRSVTGYVF